MNSPYEKFNIVKHGMSNPNDKVVYQNPPNNHSPMFKLGDDETKRNKEVLRNSPNKKWKQWSPNS